MPKNPASKAALVLRAYDHKQRQLFLDFIRQKGEATVTEVHKHFLMEQPLCSQHLALLRKHDLVKTRKQGKHVYYSVNEPQIERLLELCGQISQLN